MYDNSVNYSDSAMELVDSTGTALTGVTTDAIPLANSALRASYAEPHRHLVVPARRAEGGAGRPSAMQA
eukprot:3787195-Rhodomonas_salina.1